MTRDIFTAAGMAPASDDPPKRWMPAEWQDEIVPPARETPDAWIVSAADGVPMLAGCYHGPLGEDPDLKPTDDQPWGSPRLLSDGEIVPFCFTRDWGSAELTVRDDGTWSVDREMPSQANCVAVSGEWETVSASIADLVRNSDMRDPETWTLAYYEWSEESPFVFDAATRRFLPQGAPS